MKKENKKGIVRKWIVDILIIIVSAALYSLGVNCFISPNNIAPGGATGIAIIISGVTGASVGSLIGLINIPLLIAGFILLNKRTMVKTLISVAAITVFTDYVFAGVPAYLAENGNGILASIFGGVLLGAGLGLAYSREGSSGGTDIVTKIVSRFCPNFKLGQIQLVVDGCVVLAGLAVYRDLNIVLYAIVEIFVQSKIIDMIVYGGQESKMLMIFSDRSEEISKRLLEQSRGVTLLNGEGAYSGDKRQVIVTAIYKRDFSKVKRIIKETDPAAFVVVTNAGEVFGKGFSKLY